MKTSATKRRLLWLFAGRWPMVVVCVGLLASGCARAKAKTVPDGPPLDVPAAPPREAEPTEVEPPPLVPLMTEPARNTPPRPRTTPVREQQPPRQEPPKPAEPPKIEPPPVEAPKIEEAPKPPPSNLQTTPQQAEGEVERAIRASLSKANTDLNRVDYRLLNADARTQYDTAKRWIRQADDALRTKNLVFAKNFADKAAVIAAQLGGR